MQWPAIRQADALHTGAAGVGLGVGRGQPARGTPEGVAVVGLDGGAEGRHGQGGQ